MKYPKTRSPFIRNARKDSGSALVIALTFSCIITFGIAGILPLVLTDWKLSSRISGQEAAFSLAESGIEEAIWAILEFGEEESAWTSNGWNESVNGKYWYREWNLSDYTDQLSETYELDDNRVGSFRVVVEKKSAGTVYTGNSGNTFNTVNIVSQGIVTGGKNVAKDYRASRYIETQFKRPNPFEDGLIAKELLDFNGKPTFNSYNSINQQGVFTENVTIGSASTSASAVGLGNARIHGDLATGSADDGSESVRGNARIDGDINYDFQMELPKVPQPDTSGSGWLNQL